MRKPVLYSGTKNASSWAMRAWLALKSAGYEFEEKVIDIRRPQRFRNLQGIATFSPPACGPILDTGQNIISDSNAIMEFANDIGGGIILPRDLESRGRARSIMAWQHSGLSGICKRISFESSFYPQKRNLTDQEIIECDLLFKALDADLSVSSGPYLFGQPTSADFMLTPSVVRLARHSIDLRKWPRISVWFDAILDHEFVRAWMREADQLYHIWYDDYLLPNQPIVLE